MQQCTNVGYGSCVNDSRLPARTIPGICSGVSEIVPCMSHVATWPHWQGVRFHTLLMCALQYTLARVNITHRASKVSCFRRHCTVLNSDTLPEYVKMVQCVLYTNKPFFQPIYELPTSYSYLREIHTYIQALYGLKTTRLEIIHHQYMKKICSHWGRSCVLL